MLQSITMKRDMASGLRYSCSVFAVGCSVLQSMTIRRDMASSSCSPVVVMTHDMYRSLAELYGSFAVLQGSFAVI